MHVPVPAVCNAMLGYHHHGIQNSRSVPSVPWARSRHHKIRMRVSIQTAWMQREHLVSLAKFLKYRPKICIEKTNSPCCCVPGLWGPEIRFCGCVKHSQNIWRRIRQAPLHSCLHPEKTCPPFPCSIDVHAHSKDLRKYMKMQIVKIEKIWLFMIAILRNLSTARSGTGFTCTTTGRITWRLKCTALYQVIFTQKIKILSSFFHFHVCDSAKHEDILWNVSVVMCPYNRSQ